MARDLFRVHPTAFEADEAEQSTRSTFRDRTRTCCLALRGRATKAAFGFEVGKGDGRLSA